MSAPLINISEKQAWLFAAFFVFFEFLTYITNDMIMPGMLSVIKTFHAKPSAVATSMTIYMLGGASLQLILGPISDAIGRRPVMLFGCMLFLIFTLLLAYSQSMNAFLTGRFFQGMGLCFIIVGYAVIQELFAEMDAVRLVAIMANAGIAAPLIGPLLGAIFIMHFHWRNMYFMIFSLTLLALSGLWATMPETVGVRKTDGKLARRSKLSMKRIAVNYLRLLRHHDFMIGVIALGIIGSPCIVWIALSPLILMSKAHLSLIEYGLWQMPFFSACILGNLYLHRLTHSLSLLEIIKRGSVIATLSLLILPLLCYLSGGHYLSFIIALTGYGFGLGVTTGPLTRHLLFSTKVAKGTTNALINVMSMLLMSGSTALGNVLYQSQNNLVFAGYCAVLAGVYWLLLKRSVP